MELNRLSSFYLGFFNLPIRPASGYPHPIQHRRPLSCPSILSTEIFKVATYQVGSGSANSASCYFYHSFKIKTRPKARFIQSVCLSIHGQLYDI